MTVGSSKTLTALIAANVIVFFIISVADITLPNGAQAVVDAVCLPDNLATFIRRPWTLITYSLVQGNIIQLIFNMLWLYGFGRLLLLRCERRLLIILYIAGAIAGGIIFLGFFNLDTNSGQSMLMGSSAAIITIATSVAFIMPDAEIYVPLIGPTKTKWIAIVVITLFCIGLSAPNFGGNLAHIGGAAAGAVYGLVYRAKERKRGNSDEYDRLIDKIKTSGYDSMSAGEKRRFFELSRKR